MNHRKTSEIRDFSFQKSGTCEVDTIELNSRFGGRPSIYPHHFRGVEAVQRFFRDGARMFTNRRLEENFGKTSHFFILTTPLAYRRDEPPLQHSKLSWSQSYENLGVMYQHSTTCNFAPSTHSYLLWRSCQKQCCHSLLCSSIFHDETAIGIQIWQV